MHDAERLSGWMKGAPRKGSEEKTRGIENQKAEGEKQKAESRSGKAERKGRGPVGLPALLCLTADR